MNKKIRLRFSKREKLRFIGHLDFLRVFQQMIRRAGLPIAYSQGFNPHQIISFALPLPLGMESINDYADITITAEIPSNEIVEMLNAAAPQGLHVSAAYPFEGPTAAAATIAADYTFSAKITKEVTEKILTADTLIIPKKTKSGLKNTDIRPEILDIQTADTTMLRLSAGSAKFLNPLLVAEILTGEKACNSSLSRLELYRDNGSGGLIPL